MWGGRGGAHDVALGHITCSQARHSLHYCDVVAYYSNDGVLSLSEALQDHGGGGKALLDVGDGWRL